METAKQPAAAPARHRSGRKDGIQLSPERLKGLRDEKRLTQREVAHAVHHLLHGRPPATLEIERSILSTYQEIERTGSTSKKRAQALARFYGTSVAVLQGDFEQGQTLGQRVEAQMRALMQAGSPEALQTRMAALKGEGEGDHVQWLAEDLSHEIEQCQLTRIPRDVERLSELTAWSPEEMQNAGAQLGYWMFVPGLGLPSQMTTGVQHAMQLLKEECARMHLVDECEAIWFEEELPWLRVTIRGRHLWGRRGRDVVLSLVRCLPTTRGLEYQNPTWRDRLWFDDLQGWAYSHAPSVTWQGKKCPADIRQLRLLIECTVGHDEAAQTAELHQGALLDLDGEHLQRFESCEIPHDALVRILRLDLIDALAPHLAGWPPANWRIRAGEAGISITLDRTGLPYQLLAQAPQRPPRVAIRLVEVMADGVRAAPWPKLSIEAAAKVLSENLARVALEVEMGPPRPPQRPRL
jgi:hypothetical protein